MSLTEQDRHTAFEEMVGGPSKAFRILHIWKNTYDNRTEWDRLGSTVSKQEMKERKLRKQAKREGFNDKQINAFFALQ